MSNIYQLLKQKGTLDATHKHAACKYDHNNNEQQESSSSNESQISFARILDDTNDDDFVGPKNRHHQHHKVSSSHQRLLAMMEQENVVIVNNGINHQCRLRGTPTSSSRLWEQHKVVSDDVTMKDVDNDRHPSSRQSDDDRSVWDDSQFMEISICTSGGRGASSSSTISSLSDGPTAAPFERVNVSSPPVRVGWTSSRARPSPPPTTTTTTFDQRRTTSQLLMDARHRATYEYYRELQRVDASNRFGNGRSRRTNTRRSHTWRAAWETSKCHPHDIDIERRPSLPEVISTSHSSSSSASPSSSSGGHVDKVVSVHGTLEEDEIVM